MALWLLPIHIFILDLQFPIKLSRGSQITPAVCKYNVLIYTVRESKCRWILPMQVYLALPKLYSDCATYVCVGVAVTVDIGFFFFFFYLCLTLSCSRATAVARASQVSWKLLHGSSPNFMYSSLSTISPDHCFSFFQNYFDFQFF